MLNLKEILETQHKSSKACYNESMANNATITTQSPMNYFFESFEDYAQSGGVITQAVRDAYLDPCDAWEESFETSASHETYEDAEYREDRYEQMASRHGC